MVASSWNWDSKPSYLEPCWLHLQRSWFRSAKSEVQSQKCWLFFSPKKRAANQPAFFNHLHVCVCAETECLIVFYQKRYPFWLVSTVSYPLCFVEISVLFSVKPALSMRSSPIRICLSLGCTAPLGCPRVPEVLGSKVNGSVVVIYIYITPIIYIYTNHL